MQIDFAAASTTDGEVCGLAVAKCLVVEEFGFVGFLRCGFRLGKREIEGVFGGLLVAEAAGGGLRIDGDAVRRLGWTRHRWLLRCLRRGQSVMETLAWS